MNPSSGPILQCVQYKAEISDGVTQLSSLEGFSYGINVKEWFSRCRYVLTFFSQTRDALREENRYSLLPT